MSRYWPERELQCSFCERPESAVKRVFAGPRGAYICDECIKMLYQALEAEQAKTSKG
jgi:ATP-dependent Clp protease ATP-binding subunit ClpX